MTPAVLALFALAGVVVGFSKTAVGGLGVAAVAIFATVLPARASTGAVLLVLIVGDLVATTTYRRDADWALVRRLLPAVLPGLVLGTLFLHIVSDEVLRRSIGVVLVVLLVLQLWLRTRRTTGPSTQPHRVAAWAAGGAAGFTTMTANAAGPVMTLFLSAAQVDKRRFVGTNAWFFLVVNLVKVPFSAGLGLVSGTDVVRALALVPAVVAGGLLGRWTLGRISQARFEVLVLVASGVSAAALLV